MAAPKIDLKALTDAELEALRNEIYDEVDRRYVLAEGAERLERSIADFARAGGSVDEIVARARARKPI